MPQFTILAPLDAQAIARRVPPEYRALVRATAQSGVEYTAILFAHDRRDVVTSAPVRRALADIEIGQAILAIGSNFTAEAAALLEERGARIARLGEFYWTDETYNSLP